MTIPSSLRSRPSSPHGTPIALEPRKRPPAPLLGRLRRHGTAPLFTSCICVMELRSGAMRRADSDPFWARIEREVLARVEILPLGTEESLVAGDVLADLASRGRMIDVEDVLIGATALVRGLTVVTNNRDHFERIPRLRVEDWTT